MITVRFKKWELKEQTLFLQGNYFSGKIQLLQNKVWRIFVWHRSQDSDKTSWIVNSKLPLASFSVKEIAGQLILNSSANSSLTCSLAPFSYSIDGLNVLSLNSQRLATFEGNTGEMELLATGKGDPSLEVNDGFPTGNGFYVSLEELEERIYLGLGERTGFLDKKGRTWKNWATDEFSHDPDKDPLYMACPFIMGVNQKNCFGIYLDETWKTSFDLADTEPDHSYIHTQGPTFDLYLMQATEPKQIIQQFTDLTGKPKLPPLWAFGMHQCRWSYPDQDTVLSITNEYQKRNIPLEAIWLDIDYMEGYKNFTFSSGRFPNPEKLVHHLKQQGIKTVVIVDAGVKKEEGYKIYESGKKIDAFIKTRRDEELTGEVWPEPAVWPDFHRNDVQAWWGECHSIYTKIGIAGIWNDMNEPAAFNWKEKTIPVGSRQGKYWHAELHNVYGLQMSQATFEGLQKLSKNKRPFILTRSGFCGIQKYAFVWTGDNHSYWDRMEMSIPMLLNMGISGMSFIGTDIGGFSGNSNAEMLTRWTWLGAFYPFMRNHSGKASRRQEPWSFGKDAEKNIKAAIEFRYQLLPYLYTLAEESVKTGIPMMRALILEYPTDAICKQLYDQFLLGSNLLVAPVVRPSQFKKMVYLPKGNWKNFWNGEILQGNQWIITDAPLYQIPLFVREGSAIPFTKTHLHTTHAQWEYINWYIHVSEEIKGHLFQDDGDGFKEGKQITLKGSYKEKKLNLTLSHLDKNKVHSLTIQNIPKPTTCNQTFIYQNNTLLCEISKQHIQFIWE